MTLIERIYWRLFKKESPMKRKRVTEKKPISICSSMQRFLPYFSVWDIISVLFKQHLSYNSL